MKRTLLISAALAVVGSAHALNLSYVGTSKPAGHTSLFNAVGTFNFGNNKARLEAAGQTTVQGGNPANGWYDGNPRPTRAWEVAWDNSTGTVTFKVYASSDFSNLGSPAMTMTRVPVFTAGYVLKGLSIGTRTTSDTMSVKLSDVQFSDGGPWADVDTAEGTFSGNAFTEFYHAFNGTMGNWTLRGKTQFPTGTTTGDSMRWYVQGVQAVPEPGTMAALGLGALALLRKRRKK